MDIATLQAQILASRRITATADGATFILELPSDHAWRLAIEANRDGEGRLLQTQAGYAVLSVAITGWEGITATHFLPGAPADPLPFSTAALGALLDTRQDIADELLGVVSARLAERREARDAARKNSSSASSGT